jgi:YbbR domain-containing protein
VDRLVKLVSTWIRRALTENLGLKLFALGIAIALFALVHGAEDGSAGMSRQTFEVSVLSTVPPEGSGKILVSEVPARVSVTVEASSFVLSMLRREDLETVQIDLTQTDSRYYYFDHGDFSVPAGVRIVEIRPDSIPLVWADYIERTLPVALQLSGEVRASLEITDPITVTPDRVTLSGAKNQIDPLSAVHTELLDVTSLVAGNHRITVPLAALPPHVTAGAESVEVVLNVVPKVGRRLFADLRIEVIGPGGTVRPSTVDVEIRGEPTAVAAVVENRVIPYVDSGAQGLSGTASVPVQVRGLPDGVEVAAVVPADVFLTLAHRPGLGP